MGTRHRAAIGISEETDAVVVVVSEERGAISLCFNGNIIRDLDANSLREAMVGLFDSRPKKKPLAVGDKPREVSQRLSIEPAPPADGASEPAAAGEPLLEKEP
jgi:hypothetical protein